ncbi:MAG: hypothetical protein A2W28_09760 [Gammaproteobacteria bacterium RBG_16_51_14]|nr:MAG: hypothetical protein A2W28_09760 [Gammaproteobacteria bacterium RBG_16_51_14]
MTRGTYGYVWIASGRVLLQRSSRQARQLAAAGVSFPRVRFVLAWSVWKWRFDQSAAEKPTKKRIVT